MLYTLHDCQKLGEFLARKLNRINNIGSGFDLQNSDEIQDILSDALELCESLRLAEEEDCDCDE